MNFKNLAIGTVLTPPSPATTGTSLVLQSGEGARFLDPSTNGYFFVTAFPPDENPTPGNAEILRVTGISTDTLTIVREQKSTTAKSIDEDWIILQGVYAEDLSVVYNAPRGYLLNGKIVPSVSSNNLTVALKTLSGNDPSTSDSVYCRIGDTVRRITSALSVTKNAATNWFNSGASETAAKEIDYFVYLGYNATDGVTIGFSRVPYGTEYDDFSATTTNERYCAISTITNAASGDDYELVARFAATLSAGAGYTWTVPTFTNKNLVQRPIYETRWLSHQPTYGAAGSMTWTGIVTDYASYKLQQDSLSVIVRALGTIGGTSNFYVTQTAPFSLVDENYWQGLGRTDLNGVTLGRIQKSGTANIYRVYRYDGGTWTTGASRYGIVSINVRLT